MDRSYESIDQLKVQNNKISIERIIELILINLEPNGQKSNHSFAHRLKPQLATTSLRKNQNYRNARVKELNSQPINPANRPNHVRPRKTKRIAPQRVTQKIKTHTDNQRPVTPRSITQKLLQKNLTLLI